MTPYYQDELCTLLLGDSRVWASELRLGVDLVLTDPPYGIGYESRHNSSWTQRGSAQRRVDAFGRTANFPGIVGDDKPFDPTPWLPFGPCAFFGAQYCADRLPPSGCWIVWNKRCGKTPSLQADCELVWTNFDKVSRVVDHFWRGAMRAGEENVSRSPKLHPHQKPVALLQFILDYSDTDRGGAVLDPFCGSGSTCVAARRRGRRSIGIEIDERWLEIAAKRLSSERVGEEISA